MTQPPGPQYPTYPQQPLPPVPPPRPSLAQRIGARALRRPQPRQGVSLAGVGVGLVIIGVLVWAGDYLAGSGNDGFTDETGFGGGGGTSRHWLGVVLSLLTVAIGYALVLRQRRGPLGAAGVAATALGVPVLLGFLTFDANSGSGLPFSFDAIAIVSIVLWLATYLLVPGARGHGLYLGLAAIVLWVYIVNKAVPELHSPFALFGGFIPFGEDVFGAPDWATVAVLSLMFGLGYYGVAFFLDRSGRTGLAVPLTLAGFLATAGGILAAAGDLHEIGTGLLLIVLGLALSRYGALAGRRFTTWVWALGVGLGLLVIIVKLTEDNATSGGIALIIAGAGLVLVGHILAGLLREPDDAGADGIAPAPVTAPPGPAGPLP